MKILFNVCGDLIVEKLLPWVFECFSMFGLNKKIMSYKNCGWWYVNLLHFICIMVVWRKMKKKNLLKGLYEMAKKNDDKSKRLVRDILKREWDP